MTIRSAGASQSLDILSQNSQVLASFHHELHPDPDEVANCFDLFIVLEPAALDRDHALVKGSHAP
jgi:hypothetical protein